MDAVKMDAVRMIAGVEEVETNAITLAHADRRSGNPAVVGPGGELHPGYDLDRLVLDAEGVLVKRLTVRHGGDHARVEIGENARRVEAILYMVHFADDGGHRVRTGVVRRVRRMPRRRWLRKKGRVGATRYGECCRAEDSCSSNSSTEKSAPRNSALLRRLLFDGRRVVRAFHAISGILAQRAARLKGCSKL